MGHEFRLSFNRQGTLLSHLAERLANTGRYQIEELLGEELKLRFSGSQRRPDWPEDIVLKSNEAGLTALFHVGSASERASLLNDVREICEQQGSPVEIEEL